MIHVSLSFVRFLSLLNHPDIGKAPDPRRRRQDGPHAPQMVRDVVVHGIAARARLADAPAAEGDALQRVGVVGPPGVDEGTHIVLPGAGGGVCGCLRPVGEVCVVGFQSVSVANCTPSFKPCFFHSSVRSLRISIDLRR